MIEKTKEGPTEKSWVWPACLPVCCPVPLCPQLVQFISPSSACCPVHLLILSLSSSSPRPQLAVQFRSLSSACPVHLPCCYHCQLTQNPSFLVFQCGLQTSGSQGILQAFRITMGLFGTAETCSLVDWVSTQYGHSYCTLKANLANSSLIYIHSISYGLLENPS